MSIEEKLEQYDIDKLANEMGIQKPKKPRVIRSYSVTQTTKQIGVIYLLGEITAIQKMGGIVVAKIEGTGRDRKLKFYGVMP